MFLIFYDIKNNRFRKKVSQILEERGYVRLQYSIFAGPYHPKHTGVWNKIAKNLDERIDKCYYIKMTDQQFSNMEILGILGEDLDYVAGKLSSLII